MTQLGMGVMINMLGGNTETVTSLKAAIGKKISEVSLKDERLRIAFTDKTALLIWDDGQSCCESRYMRTDDDLSHYVGGKLRGMELRDAPNAPAKYDEHEVQFLAVQTTKGNFTMSSHVEHNGYYGGFSIQIRTE